MINVEKIVELAKESGAGVDYNSKDYGIGYTNSDGNFKPYIPPLLLQGDCLELMSKIPNKSIDMVLCDLPYNTTACKWDKAIPIEPLWNQYRRIIKDKGAIVLFGQEPFSSYLRTSNIEMYRYDWIWQKQKPSNFQLMNYQPGRVQENIMVFSKAKACYVSNKNTMNYYPQMIDRETIRKANVKIYGDVDKNILHEYKGGLKDCYKEYSKRHPTTILQYNTESKKFHSAQKPIDLLEYLINTYTKEGETILDNCMGGGSTGVACVNTNRNFIGIELDDKYFAIAKERIEKVCYRSYEG